MSVSNLNLSNSLISANWDLRFTVRNPNKKMTLYYDDIAAAVFYDYVSLSDTTVPPFYQEKRVETSQKAGFASSGSYVERRVFDEMNSERDRRGSIGFNVRMVARVRFKAGAWRARRSAGSDSDSDICLSYAGERRVFASLSCRVSTK
ncbi:hypothetical protein K7X08_005195 [Anisodus acutangulus]|uniref:Late embryogenesis abundant protein LEA-2 subgroup domain-containing protein n=1 Tax=Anisodus acutangulus TaxID=402998 RepID=A0A9Q1MIR3_9SOLA|nr:hypothetical protein K7X08_005195 [Anisodus acutangulus]